MEKNQTAINVLKQHIQDVIEKTVVDNHYESGYKQCLIDIQNKIDNGLLQMEKDQIHDALYTGCEIAIDNVKFKHIKQIEQYYNKTYRG